MLEMVAGRSKASFQSVTSLDPRFVIVNWPVNPEPQSLVFEKATLTCARAGETRERVSKAMERSRAFIGAQFA
jgi:hypothetical protein